MHDSATRWASGTFSGSNNPHEDAIGRALIDEMGCIVYRGGWPDFLVVTPRGQTLGVEVKSAQDTLRDEQRKIHTVLKSAGIRCVTVRGPGDETEDGSSELALRILTGRA